MMKNITKFFNLPVSIEWTYWIAWDNYKDDSKALREESGIYEVKRKEEKFLIYIGQTDNIERRCRQYMILGKGDHKAGEKMRNCEDTSNALEEELIRWHVSEFNEKPKYNSKPKGKIDVSNIVYSRQFD